MKQKNEVHRYNLQLQIYTGTPSEEWIAWTDFDGINNLIRAVKLLVNNYDLIISDCGIPEEKDDIISYEESIIDLKKQVQKWENKHRSAQKSTLPF